MLVFKIISSVLVAFLFATISALAVPAATTVNSNALIAQLNATQATCTQTGTKCGDFAQTAIMLAMSLNSLITSEANTQMQEVVKYCNTPPGDSNACAQAQAQLAVTMNSMGNLWTLLGGNTQKLSTTLGTLE